MAVQLPVSIIFILLSGNVLYPRPLLVPHYNAFFAFLIYYQLLISYQFNAYDGGMVVSLPIRIIVYYYLETFYILTLHPFSTILLVCISNDYQLLISSMPMVGGGYRGIAAYQNHFILLSSTIRIDQDSPSVLYYTIMLVLHFQ